MLLKEKEASSKRVPEEHGEARERRSSKETGERYCNSTEQHKPGLELQQRQRNHQPGQGREGTEEGGASNTQKTTTRREGT